MDLKMTLNSRKPAHSVMTPTEPKSISATSDFERRRRERLEILKAQSAQDKIGFINCVNRQLTGDIQELHLFLLKYTGIDIFQRRRVQQPQDMQTVAQNLSVFQN